MTQEKSSFIKDHADTLAIIAVNLTVAAILVSMCISNSSRIDSTIAATNARIDTLHIMFYDLLREVKK